MGKHGEGSGRNAIPDDVRKERQKAKVVLKEFRDHYEQIDKEKDDMLDCRSNALKEHFAKAESNQRKARTVNQAYVDAQIFHKLGEYSRRQAAQLQTGLKSYDVKTFVDALSDIMTKSGDNRNTTEAQINFTEIGGSLYNLWRTVPGVDFMYGNAPSDEARPARQRRKPVRVRKGLVTDKPSQLERGDVEQTETDKQVAKMRAELRRRRTVNFWHFVVDPDENLGFTRTIENIFHSSFLIKDMFAKLDMRKDPPILEYTDPSAAGGEGGGESMTENSQVIMGVDRNMWKGVISKYQIKRAMVSPMKATNEEHDENLERLEALAARRVELEEEK